MDRNKYLPQLSIGQLDELGSHCISIRAFLSPYFSIFFFFTEYKAQT